MYWKIRKLWKKYPQYFWGDQLDVRYFLCEQVAKLKNKRILDLGCNIGLVSGCADESNQVEGVDTEEYAIKVARSLFPKNKYDLEDIWKHPKKKYDVVLLVNMIEIFPKAKRQLLINKVASLLDSNGILFLTTPNRNNPYYLAHDNKLTLAELMSYLEGKFVIEKVIYWNPLSIHAWHLLKIPGAYLIIKLLSILFRSQKSVGIYLKAQKV